MVGELAASSVICREITENDLDGVARLLAKGFGIHSLADWQHACRQLLARPWPSDCARFGWMLEAEGRVVGCLLTIFTTIQIDGRSELRCSPSSWFVDEKYRGHSMRIARQGFHASELNETELTYINSTPSPATYGMLKHLGFQPYCKGYYMAFTAATPSARKVQVREFNGDAATSQGLLDGEAQLLADHRSQGCISLVCDTGDEVLPFVFIARQLYLPYGSLIYCRSVSDVVTHAGPIGRFLARRGIPLLAIDSDGPIPGLIGHFFDNNPKFYKGPRSPRLGDLAYTELAMFPSLFHCRWGRRNREVKAWTAMTEMPTKIEQSSGF